MLYKNDIANLALGFMGDSLVVSDIDTENTTKAKILRRMFPISLSTFLEYHPWACAKKQGELTLHEADPTEVYAYSYSSPSDCHVVRQIEQDGIFLNLNQYEDRKMQWEEVMVAGAMKLWTNVPDAHIEYTVRLDEDGAFPDYFARGLAAQLCMDSARQIVTNNWPKVKDMLLKECRDEKYNAVAYDMSRQPQRKDSHSPFYNVRL